MIHTNELNKTESKVIFDSGNYTGIEIGGKFYDRFGLLALATSCKSSEAAWGFLKLASIMFHPQDDHVFNALYEAVTTHLAYWENAETLEYSLYPQFEKAVNNLFGENAKIIRPKEDRHHRPDSWVQIGETLIPVEMKKSDFDGKALKQLTRYMNFYQCKNGVAVGSRLSVKIPKSIRFINISEFVPKGGIVRRFAAKYANGKKV